MPLLSAANLSAGKFPTGLLLIAFCARWCGVCREFRILLEKLADEKTQFHFAWIDIEDDIDEIAEIDTLDFENFPVIGIFRGENPLYFGASAPGESIILRLLDSTAGTTGPLCEIPEEIRNFARRIQHASTKAA